MNYRQILPRLLLITFVAVSEANGFAEFLQSIREIGLTNTLEQVLQPRGE